MTASNTTPCGIAARPLGRSGPDLIPLGMGCWAIGGPSWTTDGKPVGWGEVDDVESIRALRRAYDLGITFFDTADVYGAGHSETIIGQALAAQREHIVIATKFGFTFEPATRLKTGQDLRPEYVREACLASLQRLQTDYIDLFQLHIGKLDAGQARAIRDALEDLVQEGLIRFYGHSTDVPELASIVAEGTHGTAVQQAYNLFRGNTETLRLCEQHQLASINRSPLAMGVLTGKYTTASSVSEDDVRSQWPFSTGWEKRQLEILPRVQEALRTNGRSLTQGALAWLWARSPVTIPIPGFRTTAQVEENVAALRFGPLEADAMSAIAEVLEDELQRT